METVKTSTSAGHRANGLPGEIWAPPVSAVLKTLGATAAGLTGAEAEARRRSCGLNLVQAHRRQPLWLQFLSHFLNPLLLILLFASALSAVIHAADVGISVDSAADVAKEAASLILLEPDLSVVHEAVLEGRRTVQNVTKYILMGASSNFGNMFSMAGAALFLPFLSMLLTQVLLNNLLYDASEDGVPLDNVEEGALAKPVQWDLPLIQHFMLVLGPVSSLFDFLTFYVLFHLFGASEALFQTGWFVESLATQVLVIFVIRTRHRPWHSRPHPLLAGLTLGAAAIGALLPLTPLGLYLGFVPPPTSFYGFLAAAVLAYLALVELVKRLFFRLSGAATA